MLATEVFTKVSEMIVLGVSSEQIRDFIYTTGYIDSDISTGETMVLAVYLDGAVSYTANFNKVRLLAVLG